MTTRTPNGVPATYFQGSGAGAARNAASRDHPLLASSRQEYHDRYANLSKSVWNWQRIAFGTALAAVIAVVLAFVMAMQPRAVPYIIEVDKLGQVGMVVKASDQTQPSQDAERAWVATWIKLVRETTIDYSVAKENLDKTYAMTGSNVAGQLNAYYKDHNPYSTRDGTTRVQIVSVRGLATHSYAVIWRQTLHSPAGVDSGSQDFTATITLGYAKGSTEEQILANPTGLYAAALDWGSGGG